MASPLRQILAPDSLDRFLAHDYQQRAARLPHRGARRVGDVVSLEELDRVLWRGGRDLSADVIRRAGWQANEVFDRPRGDLRDWLLEGYRQGKSIVAARAQRHFPSLATLVRTTAIELGGRASATVVLSPAPYGTLSATETFIVQVEGGQSAHLGTPSCPCPLERQLDAGPGEAATEFALEPHDILYLPGGTPVELRPSGDDALHLQLHVEPYRWMNLLEDMIESAARESLALRRCVGSLLREEAVAALAGQLSNEAETLASAAMALSRRRQVAESEPLPGSSLTDPSRTPTEDTWLERVDGSLCHVERDGACVTIEFAARRQAMVTGPAFIEPALRFIAAARAPFRAADVPAFGALDEALVLVNRLIAEGLIRVREPR